MADLDSLYWLNKEKDLPTAVDAYERFWIERALENNKGTARPLTGAAEDLGITYQQLGFILRGRQKGLYKTTRRKSKK